MPDPAALRLVEALDGSAVFFGHQSVGENILQGVREIAGRLPTGLRDAAIGRNGEPLEKIAEFERILLSPEGRGYRAAAMKLCYVDVDARADSGAVFGAYRAAVERIAAARPELALMHCTVPLTVAERGPKAALKRLLGRPVDHDDRAREEFNGMMRGAYGESQGLFDLARWEATDPRGRCRVLSSAGATYLALLPAYSEDGGHLNAAGRARVAMAFLEALVRVAA